MSLVATLLAVFMVGLLGSLHCFGMCGGIAAAMGSDSTGQGGRRPRAAVRKALLFNAGRILSYTFLGLVVGTITAAAGQILEFQQWGFFLRLLTALMIFLIGLQYFTNKSYLSWLERCGNKLWQLIKPKAAKSKAAVGGNESWRVLRYGMLWGWLPCGLVYTVLLTAAASGSPVPAALIMLAFGLGTLPALASLGVVAPLISQLKSSLHARKIIGVAMMLFALWIAGWAYFHSGHAANDGTVDSTGTHQH